MLMLINKTKAFKLFGYLGCKEKKPFPLQNRSRYN